ncbi:DUF4291 domain-containing protein [Nocardia stercoris]|uniref:DUF4291 domain-containing protein n=1 Tax=Nocardia stercoris TaxID=2483361 RepID=A0A3M2KZN5_9NOCA|nr:DUF4291 domain-containing protein [Nocardia stercoris]RMI29920.1 DUF4291 domain-containing protein [Nocardia stercoris]
MSTPFRQIRADFDDRTVVVYQAYRPEIAGPAAASGRFGGEFKRARMTWIKPSFLWMMYRCGWASKPGQERVLAITVTRAGFEWALRNSALSHLDRSLHRDVADWRSGLSAPVRVQWDPERDTHLRPLPHRSLQVGLSGPAVDRYCDEWITGIEDVTERARTVRGLVAAGDDAGATRLLPVERPYPLPDDIAARIGCR